MYSQEQEKYYFDQAKKFLAIDVPENEASYELLKKVIKYADWKYYVQSNPLLADVEYDILFKQLQKGITPGQFAAWYSDNELLGSGVIA